MQRCKGAKVQRCKGSKLKGEKVQRAKVQRCKCAKVQRCKGAELPSCQGGKCNVDSLKNTVTDKQANGVTSSLLELLVAAKNLPKVA